MSEDNGLSALPSTVKAYTGIVTTGILIGGLGINLTSICTVSLYERVSQSSIYLVLANLFLCNIILVAFQYPVSAFHIVQNWPSWQYSTSLCRWWSLGGNACPSIVVLSLLLLSVDRYFVTVQRKALPPKVLGVLSFLVWLSCGTLHGIDSFGASNPMTIETSQSQKQQSLNLSVCNAFVGQKMEPGQLVYSKWAIVHITCIVVTLTLILRVGAHVWRGQLRGPVKMKKDLKQQFKIAFIVILFTAAFYLPEFGVAVTRGHRQITVTSRLMVLTHVLSSINTLITGVVCIMFSKDFRRASLDMARGCRQLRARFGAVPSRKGANEMSEPLTENISNQQQQQQQQDHTDNRNSKNNNNSSSRTSSVVKRPLFVKGQFKSWDKDDSGTDLCCVSIDSVTLEEEAGPGCKNKIYEESCKGDEVFDYIDSKF